MNELKIGSLFSGIGGIELGFEKIHGFKTRWFVENDAYAQAVLRKNFKGIPIYGDIKTINFKELERVDILTGGFPCQDISNAGKRKGITGERSGLWKEFLKRKTSVQLDGSKGIDWTKVKGDKWTDGMERNKVVNVLDLGLFFCERGGKDFFNFNNGQGTDNEIVPTFEGKMRSALDVIYDTHSEWVYSRGIICRARDFLDCLGCLGEEKVKELIKDLDGKGLEK